MKHLLFSLKIKEEENGKKSEMLVSKVYCLNNWAEEFIEWFALAAYQSRRFKFGTLFFNSYPLQVIVSSVPTLNPQIHQTSFWFLFLFLLLSLLLAISLIHQREHDDRDDLWRLALWPTRGYFSCLFSFTCIFYRSFEMNGICGII